jgi:hypothetical protein
MIRTQVSLDEEAYHMAKEESRRSGISLAEFVRRSLAAALTPRKGKKPWMRYAGTLRSEDSGASRSVDEVVYGRPRP